MIKKEMIAAKIWKNMLVIRDSKNPNVILLPAAIFLKINAAALNTQRAIAGEKSMEPITANLIFRKKFKKLY